MRENYLTTLLQVRKRYFQIIPFFLQQDHIEFFEANQTIATREN